jgi:hypothetical protein
MAKKTTTKTTKTVESAFTLRFRALGGNNAFARQVYVAYDGDLFTALTDTDVAVRARVRKLIAKLKRTGEWD